MSSLEGTPPCRDEGEGLEEECMLIPMPRAGECGGVNGEVVETALHKPVEIQGQYIRRVSKL